MVYILGAGGMAKETLNIYRDLGRFEDVFGFIEENCEKDQPINNKKLMDAAIINSLPKKSTFIGAIGSPTRERWLNDIELLNFDFETVLHPSVIKGDSVNIKKGCIICPGVILTSTIEVGKHSIINVNTTLNHDCVIGDFVTIGPGVSIAGNVTIKDRTWIGIGATIINNISIGQGSFIGAGSVVTKDIPDNVLAMGVPAKSVKEINNSDWNQLI